MEGGCNFIYRNKQIEIQNLDRQLASKSAQLGILNDLQSRMEGFSEGVKAILTGRISEAINPNDAKIVSQNIDIAPEWTSAFETMLGSARKNYTGGDGYGNYEVVSEVFVRRADADVISLVMNPYRWDGGRFL